MDLKANDWWLAFAVSLAGGVAWWFGTGLHPLWWVMWLAPLPALLLAPRIGRTPAALAAFTGYLLGALNMWSYYTQVVPPLTVRLTIIVLPAALFACCVLAFRRLVLRGRLISAVLLFPSLWTGVVYLQELASPHSTFGDLAYTQMNCLPLLQVVSLTGIGSVVFLLFLFAAVVAVLFTPCENRALKMRIALGTVAVLGIVLGFGAWRLSTTPQQPRVTIGLIDSDAHLYRKGEAAVELMRDYAAQIPALAAKGAQVVVIPEKIVGIGGNELTAMDSILEQSARTNNVDIVVGVERLPNFNESRFYARDGQLAATYEKHHMLPIFESYMVVGTKRTLVDESGVRTGLTICKDMDFPKLSRQYSEDGARLMLVPAWDFVTDGWLHGRMAILRGVESGFSMGRAAKEGTLTVTDDRGRVLAEAVTSKSGFVSLVAGVPAGTGPTLYARLGDWFAWANLAMLVVLLWRLWR